MHYGKQLMQVETNFKSSMSDIIQNSRSKLRFGISRLRSNAFLPLIWERFYKLHPNIDIEITNGNSQHFEELLQLGKIDLYMGVDMPALYKRVKVSLGKEQIWCCINRELLTKYFPNSWSNLLDEFKENGVDPKKISNMPFISLRKDNKVRKKNRFISN